MRRREFIGLVGGAAVWPVIGRSQEPSVLRLGVVSGQPRSATLWVAFERRMAELGYQQGVNFTFDHVLIASTEGNENGYRELVTRKVNVILANGPEIALRSAIAASRTLPIIMIAIDYDPLGLGYVQSLARPTGNVTGLFYQQIELTPKRVMPSRPAGPEKRPSSVWDPASADQWQATQRAGEALGVRLAGIELREPPYDYERALGQAPPDHRSSLFVMTSPFLFRDRERLADFLLRHRIASIFVFREWVEAGSLLSYGPNIVTLHLRAAEYIDRIARGAPLRPASRATEETRVGDQSQDCKSDWRSAPANTVRACR